MLGRTFVGKAVSLHRQRSKDHRQVGEAKGGKFKFILISIQLIRTGLVVIKSSALHNIKTEFFNTNILSNKLENFAPIKHFKMSYVSQSAIVLIVIILNVMAPLKQMGWNGFAMFLIVPMLQMSYVSQS